MGNIIMGFEFNNIETYSLAKKELDYVTKIKEKNITSNSKKMLEIYNKIIEDGVFKTPIGMEFLRGMQKELYLNKEINNELIRSIPAIVYKEENASKTEASNKTTNKNINNPKKSKYKDLYIKMLIINFVLVITIVIMFVITKQADKFDPNYYRESIEDSYMSWQRELEERESSLNSRENGE